MQTQDTAESVLAELIASLRAHEYNFEQMAKSAWQESHDKSGEDSAGCRGEAYALMHAATEVGKLIAWCERRGFK